MSLGSEAVERNVLDSEAKPALARFGLSFVLALIISIPAGATVVAYDDAADPIYNPGNYHGLNGGLGFNAWSTNGFPIGGNPALQAFVSSSSVNGPPGPDIDTAGSLGPVAWGNYVQPGGNTFTARRNLISALTVGGTYSLDFDTGSCDGQETITFGQASSVLCQFYFNASFANYQFYDALSSTTTDSGILQTFGGLHLAFALTSPTTYSFQATRLTDSFTFNIGPLSYDTSIFTAIRTLTVTNVDGGNGLGHSMYVNRLQATQVPEPSSILTISLGATLLVRRNRRSINMRP